MTTDLLIAGITALTGVNRSSKTLFTNYEWRFYTELKTQFGSGFTEYVIFLAIEALTGNKVVVMSDDMDAFYGTVISSWLPDTVMLRAYDKAMERNREQASNT